MRWLWVFLKVLLLVGGCKAREPANESGDKFDGVEFDSGVIVDKDGTGWLDFGKVSVGMVEARTVTISDRYGKGSGLEVSGVEAPFLLLEEPRRLQAHGEAELRLGFLPDASGRWEGEVEISTDTGSLLLRLQGEGIAEERRCEVEVSPEALRYRFVEEAADLPFPSVVRIRSIGDGACILEEATLEGDFTGKIRGEIPAALSPGATAELHLEIFPVAEGAGSLRLGISGEEYGIPLATKDGNDCLMRDGGHEGQLEILAFGCSESVVRLENRCDGRIGLRADREGEWIFGELDWPLELPPGGEKSISLSFEPRKRVEVVEGRLVVTASNGDRVHVPLEARPKWHEEIIILEPTKTWDLLLVIDNSHGMEAYQDALQSLGRKLLEQMDRQWDVDYQFMVTTTSMEVEGECGGEAGRLIPLDGSRPQVVRWDTPDRDEVLLENLRVGTCQTPGRGAGLAAIEAAMADGFPPWRRDGAGSLIISVQDDHSPKLLSYYREAYGAKWTEANRFLDFFGFYVPYGECKEASASRYLELSDFASSWEMICRPELWMNEMSVIGVPRMFEFYVSALGGRFDRDSSVDVWVDGVEVPNSASVWYNRLIFQGDEFFTLARRGSEVRVRYPISCAVEK